MFQRIGLQFLLFSWMAGMLSAQTFNTLFRFDVVDGISPGQLSVGLDGNLYGTTYYQQGTLFKITPGGALATLYTFCADGSAARRSTSRLMKSA